ncbi:uncharacterized protein LOC117176375 [Belonocnema kinseyi]|uniref:uncharacterized protein LOC117176375 n=1 Tax=Belonocnema kinseyi TaxID=2817044 RepID=UPI00143D13CF|nr:uncharacterized protein LOC117176375 [Belonocnema kinseyi]
MVEGQKIVNSGLIFMCGASSRSSTKIELYALCLKTSALSSPEPHVLTGTLSIHHEDTMLPDELDQFDEHDVDPIYVRVKSMNCSCKAGTSHSCRHIVGVLLYCNRKDLNSLPMLSSTDMQCLWNKQKRPFLEQFEAQPTKYFCCVRQKRLPALSETVQAEIRQRLIQCDEKTALAKHSSRNLHNRNTNRRSDLTHSTQNDNIINHEGALSKPPARVPFQDITNKNSQVFEIRALIHNESTKKDYTQIIIANASSSTILDCIREVNHDLADCCNKMYQSKITCNDVLKTCIATRDCPKTWKQERQFRITGSRCYSLFTYSNNDWPDKSIK